jgi:hypothetical protein
MNAVREIMSSTSPPSRFAEFLRKFTILSSAPRELWIILIAYALENVGLPEEALTELRLILTQEPHNRAALAGLRRLKPLGLHNAPNAASTTPDPPPALMR